MVKVGQRYRYNNAAYILKYGQFVIEITDCSSYVNYRCVQATSRSIPIGKMSSVFIFDDKVMWEYMIGQDATVK
jgi:hypothetical protein